MDMSSIIMNELGEKASPEPELFLQKKVKPAYTNILPDSLSR